MPPPDHHPALPGVRHPSALLLSTLALALAALSCSRAQPQAAAVASAAPTSAPSEPDPVATPSSEADPAAPDPCLIDKPCTRDLDLDGDGRREHVTWYYDGGTGFGGWSLRIEDPAGDAGDTPGSPVRLEVGGSLGNLVWISTVDPRLAARPQRIDALLDLLPGAAERRALCDPLGDGGAPDRPCIDPAFAWLTDVYRSGVLPPRGPLLSRSRFQPRWTRGRPRPAPAQYVIVRDPRDAGVVRGALEASSEARPGRREALLDTPKTDAPYAVLSFGGLGRLGEAVPCGDWASYRSAHAVALLDPGEQRWTWAYLTPDYVVRLRWPSIARVACAGGLVVIERSGLDRISHDVVVVDPRRGRLGVVGRGVTEWSVDEAQIALVDAGGPRRVTLAAVRRALD